MEGKHHTNYRNSVGDMGGWKQSLLAVRRNAASIAALDLYFFRGTTTLQMSNSCIILMTLHSRRRLRRSAPNLLVGVTRCFSGVGG